MNSAHYGMHNQGYRGSNLKQAAWHERKRKRKEHKAARRRNRK